MDATTGLDDFGVVLATKLSVFGMMGELNIGYAKMLCKNDNCVKML